MRHYAFQGIASDRTRTEFIVGTDLQLIRKYQIAVQELPLLCRRLLEEHMLSDPQTTVFFTEEDMRLFAKNRAEAKELAAHRAEGARLHLPSTIVDAPGAPRANTKLRTRSLDKPRKMLACPLSTRLAMKSRTIA